MKLMKTNIVPNRMTRFQVQEKFKENFQALCAQCPQLAKNHETLDDSLTNLQWLWNLNVNISNPTEGAEKGSQLMLKANTALLTFPGSRSAFESDVTAGSPITDSQKILTSSSKQDILQKQCLQVQQPVKSAKLAASTCSDQNKSLLEKQTETSNQAGMNQPSLSNRYLKYSSVNSRLAEKLKRGEIRHSTISQSCSNSNDSESRSNSSRASRFSLGPVANLSNAKEDYVNSDTSPHPHYSFSPREAMLDILPGQVDYKNNPYVKPPFSVTTLICMALQSNKNKRLTQQGACKWITDNFIYYRYADPRWQNSVKASLTQSKCFSKVHKKNDSPNCLYELSREYNLKLRNVTLPLFKGNVHEYSLRLEKALNQVSPAGSLSIPSINSFSIYDFDESLINRKRKQTTPQKLPRPRNHSAKKRRDNNLTSTNAKNLLQEEAPELGSLKGDFNWSTIFDEFFGAHEGELNVTTNSSGSRSMNNDAADNNDTFGRFTDDVVTGSLLAHDILISPDHNDNEKSSSRPLCKSAKWHSPSDCTLNSSSDKNEHADNSKATEIPDLNITIPQIDILNPINVKSNSQEDTMTTFIENVVQFDLDDNEREIVESEPERNFNVNNVSSENPDSNCYGAMLTGNEFDRLFSSPCNITVSAPSSNC